MIFIGSMVIGALVELEFGHSYISSQSTDQARIIETQTPKNVGTTVTKMSTAVQTVVPTPSWARYTGNGDGTFYYTIKNGGRHTFHMQYGPGGFTLHCSSAKDHTGRPYTETIRVTSVPRATKDNKWQYIFKGEGVFTVKADGPWIVEIEEPKD